MSLFRTMKSFWPQGRELYVALALVGVIAATCYFNVCFMCDKVEQVAEAKPSESPSFNLEQVSVDPKKIFAGGPPKDGIPSLTNPEFVEASEAGYMAPDDRVVGVNFKCGARAYPLKILQWHEVINDQCGDYCYAVVYCPLCDSTTIFNRKVDGVNLEFGVSGLVYQSNVLIYDRQDHPDDESLWSQLKGEAVSGKRMGETLALLPHQLVTWSEWRKAYPQTKVLSDDTGHERDYTGNIYQHYFASDDLMFPVEQNNQRLSSKEPILGLRYNGESKAYPLALLDQGVIYDVVGGKKVMIEKTSGNCAFVRADTRNQQDEGTLDPGVDVIHSFWFSWNAFYPDSKVYEGKG
ncbi:DUF3179 domain-containing protein [bacterium]|nr:DUF3179 domain-containing protein [bacterium]